MGSTFVDFRGNGFEASDTALEVWLALLVQEIDKMEHTPAWLLEVRDEWHLQATAAFGFGVMPGLDRFISDEERRESILGLCLRAQTRLKQFGDVISRENLNALQTGEGSAFTNDVPAEVFLRTARYFIKLLQGTLASNEVDARFDSDALTE
jgi:hypothetical protein